MIKVIAKITPRITVEIEAKDDKEAFKKLGSAHEVYGVRQCGMSDCGSEDLSFSLREADGNTFPEIVCNKCRARLAYGQKKKGEDIYPRRKYHEQHKKVTDGQAKADTWMPDGGWERYVKPKG